MSIEYLGLSEINGPLIVLEGVKNAFFEEMVEFVVEGGKRKKGRIVLKEHPYQVKRPSHGDWAVAGDFGPDF